MINASGHYLADMLRYRRPGGSVTEENFISKFIKPLGCNKDTFGNYFKVIDNQNILWSSHTDTVHLQEGMQDVVIKNGLAESYSNCLGADCTTGVFIMSQMIRNRVPGLYVFHREEETGGLGSRWLAQNFAKELGDSQFAIAFDRKRTSSIITHQMGRCCSDEFAESLAAALNMDYEKDSTGTFTDTANYTDIIGECTNISVGYYNQHTPNETQDIDFACALADRMCTADFSHLVTKRQPGEMDEDDQYMKFYGSYNDERYGRGMNYRGSYASSYGSCLTEDGTMCLEEIVESYPRSTAAFLESLGFSEDDLLRFIHGKLSASSRFATHVRKTTKRRMIA